MHVECSTIDPTWFEDLKNIMNSGSFNLRNVSMYVGNFEVGRPCLWITKSRGLKTTILCARDIAFYCQIIRERLECSNHVQKC